MGRAADPVQIDLRRVIAGKSPMLFRLMPRPLLRYLERIVHVEELNEILRSLHGSTGIEFARRALEQLGARVESVDAERVGEARRPIVVANHPLGGLDGLALLSSVAEQVREVVLPANDLLMHLEGLRPVLVPVNKHGSNRLNREAIDRAFSGTTAIAHFPAGLCSRRKGDRVRDLEWQKSFVTRARRHERDVVPVHVEGENSAFFYNLARLRRWSGLGFNVEMLYLVDEMFKQRGRTIRLTFGRPIRWETLRATGVSDWLLARAISNHTYRLARDPDVEFTWRG
ncbi:MAG: glycerol acyltransferase [Spirochaetota bacterium]